MARTRGSVEVTGSMEEPFDTIEFRVFRPGPSRFWDLDDGGMALPEWEIVANGETLNAGDPINWEALVESTARGGEHYLSLCPCGFEGCSPVPPFEIRHRGDAILCRIRWPGGSPVVDRDYRWSKSTYIAAVATALRCAQRILMTRPPTEEELRYEPGLAGELVTSLGHGGFTLRDFHACLERFRVLHGHSIWRYPLFFP